jgi:crotonobetainyl-CoA:carnitine CoA-transferase CaiB-like acyl-CoA transferase
MKPLEGLRVLELTRVGPPAIACMFLADMGAEVLKVEPPPAPGETGTALSPPPADRRRIASPFINRGKRSICLDLKRREGQEVLQRLAAAADVLVEGFRPGVAARLGADYPTLREINPRLIYCSMSGYGQDGPYRDLPGHDLNYIATAGLLALIGARDAPPVIPLNIVADIAGAALHGVIGILLALHARQRTGEGQLVDISYLDAAISLTLLTPPAAALLARGEHPERGKGVLAGGYPYYSAYQTRDGRWLAVGCVEPWLWANLCHALGRPDLEDVGLQPGDFTSWPSPEQERAREELAGIFRNRDRDEWFDILRQHNVCVSPVLDLEEALEDPQVRHRQMVVEVDHPLAGRLREPGLAIKLSETPGAVSADIPFRGQHTREVMEQLGYSQKEIDAMAEEGAVWLPART